MSPIDQHRKDAAGSYGSLLVGYGQAIDVLARVLARLPALLPTLLSKRTFPAIVPRIFS